MQIHEQVAELLEHGERRRRAVDKLPVAACLGERAFDDEITLDAAFKTMFFEFGVERAAIVYVEAGFHRAGIRPGADEGSFRRVRPAGA